MRPTTKTKFNFVPVGRSTRFEPVGGEPTVNITHGAIKFPKHTVAQYNLQGKFLRFFVDMDGKAIAIQTKDKTELAELAQKQFRVLLPQTIRVKKTGKEYLIYKMSINRILTQLDMDLHRTWSDIPVEEYRDDIYGKLLVVRMPKDKNGNNKQQSMDVQIESGDTEQKEPLADR